MTSPPACLEAYSWTAESRWRGPPGTATRPEICRSRWSIRPVRDHAAMHDVTAPVTGTVISVAHQPDEEVRPGEALLVLESMKMEHEVLADVGGLVRSIEVELGQTVEEGQRVAVVEPGDVAAAIAHDGDEPDGHRADLEAVVERHALGLDPARRDAVDKRRDAGRRTARENLEDLVDPGTYVEYGPLIFAAQERRRPQDELIRRPPAGG